MSVATSSETGSHEINLFYPPPPASDWQRTKTEWRPFVPEFGQSARQVEERRARVPAVPVVEVSRGELLEVLGEASPIPAWPRSNWRRRLAEIDLTDGSSARRLKELETCARDYLVWRTGAYLVDEIHRANGDRAVSRRRPTRVEIKAERQRWDEEREAYRDVARKLRSLRYDVEKLRRLRQSS